MSPQPCPNPLRPALEEVADALGDTQMILAGIIEYGGGIGRAGRRKKLADVSRRLHRLADSLEQYETTDDQDRRMRSTQLVEELLQVVDKAELLSPQVNKAGNLPPPMRASISDRLLQLASLLRFAVTEMDHPLGADKTRNAPVDA